MLIGALEFMVVDEKAPVYARGLAFYQLLKIWTACRTDDLKLTSLGLAGVLERTKTSGAGKHIRHLPIYISPNASMMVPNWLEVGTKIWSRPEMCFKRDFFLPLPRDDWSGARHVLADAGDTAGLCKQLWRLLRLPRRHLSTWCRSNEPLFHTEAALCFWTGHSARNWLPSMLAAIGAEQQHRNFVGRWLSGTSADEYVRTAQRVILHAQDQVVSYFCGNDKWALRNAGVEGLQQHLENRGVPKQPREKQCSLFLLPEQWCSRNPLPPKELAVDAAEPAADTEVAQDSSSPYFVVIVGKKKFRRLHRRNACGVSSLEVQESEPAWELQGLQFDLACKHCWRPGNCTLSEAEEADDSGSSGSDND